MAEIGYLTVRIYTSDARLPIEGASLTVTQPTENGTRLLALRLSDQSGRIAPIPIETPEKAQSLRPGGTRPWTNVDLLAEHPAYERVIVERVQLFSGVVTLQDLELIPLSERPDAYNMTEVVDITAQSL